MYIDSSDPQNIYYQCSITAEAAIKQKDAEYLIARRIRSETIAQEGIDDDMNSRSYKSRSNITDEVKKWELLLAKDTENNN